MTSPSRPEPGAGQRVRSRLGTRQAGVRLYNERLVLTIVRDHDGISKAEIARLTGLSAQTISVIVRSLERDRLLRKGKAVRGKIGQPSQPFSLNAEGAFAVGLKVGRRSSNLICLDFRGSPRARFDEVYAYPTPDQVIRIARKGLAKIEEQLGRKRAAKISGIGIASPFEMWNWQQEVGAPHQAMESWRGVDIAAEIAAISPWPVHYCNDATAACAAELFFGRGRKLQTFVSFYVGFFIGGGIVIDGSLFQGRSGYAGALGPLPVPTARGPEQLIRHASLYELEKRVAALGHDPLMLTRQTEDWSALGAILDGWIAETAEHLAWGALSAVSVIDFEAVIIDGAMPPHVRAALVAETRRAFERLDRRGIAPVEIVAGETGRDARALGAASLPLFANFMTDRDVLFRAKA